MKVLLVKLSSMGDLIHALPALTDAMNNIPGITFDWVVEKSFSDIPYWHPAVKRIIETDHRNWRKNIKETIQHGKLIKSIREIRREKYDVVIDGQSNFKSAFFTFLARGTRCGPDKHSSCEPFTGYAYQRKFKIDKSEHAIKRMRLLFAHALGYAYHDTPPDSAISHQRLVKPKIEVPYQKFFFFIHNASWHSKLWPETYWQKLIKLTTNAGYNILLPSGNAAEFERSQKLAQDNAQVMALPIMTLTEIAYIISKAKLVVCTDTGLSHLSSALNISSITLYGSTDPKLIGAIGQNNIQLQANFPCSPCYNKSCKFKGASVYKPACYMSIPPERVWREITKLLAKTIVVPKPVAHEPVEGSRVVPELACPELVEGSKGRI
ncbi:MAG: lipopolysaccharide heptosyltransferase I [Pseudomonadota bacterium]